MIAEAAARTVNPDGSAGERVSLNNVQVDGLPHLDCTGSTDHDDDDSEVSTEADFDEDAPNGDSKLKKQKKISNRSPVMS